MVSPSKSPSSVFLTGATGFTGRYVAEALASAGFEVIDPAANDVGFDLRNAAGLKDILNDRPIDYVIHLAALSFVANADAASFYGVNTIGTANLLEALARSGRPLRKVVIASSANVYGNACDDPISEQTLPAPVNHYACSKLSMEHIARTFERTLPLLIIRPFNYTGPGQAEHFLVPKLVSHFAQRLPTIRLGNLDVVRDFSDVRAVANAYVRLLQSAAVGETINLCSGVGRSLRWIVKALADISAHQIEVVVDPDLVRASEVRRLVGDPSRLTERIGAAGFGDFRATLLWMLEQADSLAKGTVDARQSQANA